MILVIHPIPIVKCSLIIGPYSSNCTVHSFSLKVRSFAADHIAALASQLPLTLQFFIILLFQNYIDSMHGISMLCVLQDILNVIKDALTTSTKTSRFGGSQLFGIVFWSTFFEQSLNKALVPTIDECIHKAIERCTKSMQKFQPNKTIAWEDELKETIAS